MANKYALQPFFWHQAAGIEQFVEVGALRDSASAVVAAAPSMFTTAMTIGATGVASLNPNPVPVSVTITGGTVTVIAVNGVVTGLTTGTFTIPAGGSITVTYSVGPTFTMADIAPAAGVLVTGVLAQYLAVTQLVLKAAAVKFATDKISHGYFPTYLRIAAQLGPAARVCEVGVEHGHGLDLFQALFPDGLIVGVDANGGCRWPQGTFCVICDQDSETLPGRLAQHSVLWDLIVDDASHLGKLTAETFRLLWPMVAPGGFYVIEDWMVALGWHNYDESMLTTVAGLLPLLTKVGDVEDITYRYGLAVLRKKAP